jgi:hypothetical protein
MSQDKTLELVVQELQNRIGQITSQYETQMALLKAQAQQAIESKDAEIASLQTPAKEEKSK